jgi:hypothetical protein
VSRGLQDAADRALSLARAAGGGSEVALLACAGADTVALIAGRWRAGTIEALLDQRADGLSLLAWEGGAAAWDDHDVALAPGPDGRPYERMLCQSLDSIATPGPALADLPEGWTALPSPWETRSAHARLLWESVLPGQIRKPAAILDGGARILRRGALVALCPAHLSTPLGLRRIP